MAWNDRRPYESATALTQPLLDACADNLDFRIETVCDIETPAGTIRASDRNKYVGGTYYGARMQLPNVKRTIGEWLAPVLEFSTLQVTVSNVDGLYNPLMPGGANWSGWVGKALEVRNGLYDIASSYRRQFKGYITEVGGFSRDSKSLTVVARDEFDRLNKTFPVAVWERATWPKLGDNVVGTGVPVVYGDWTVATEPHPAVVPAVVVNGGDPFVDFRDRNMELSLGSPGTAIDVAHCLDSAAPIEVDTNGTLPSPLTPGGTYYAVLIDLDTFGLATSPGGPAIALTGPQSGQHRFRAAATATRTPVHCAVTTEALRQLQADQIYVKRGDGFYLVPGSELSGLVAGNNEFKVAQDSAVLWVDGKAYTYQTGDTFVVRCKGRDLGANSDNVVAIARDILERFGGAVAGDFHASWATYQAKATPAQSAVALFKARVFEHEEQQAMQYALSLLEQVRLEAFIDANRQLKINAMHFEDWPTAPAFTVKNWDLEQGKFTPKLDDRNVFNRCAGDYNYSPLDKRNSRQTPVLRNQAAVTQMGKEISKKIVFPNLYDEATVKQQCTEILRLASAQSELVEFSISPRAMLQDLGDWVRLGVAFGASVFEGVPAMIREVSQDPSGVRINMKVWAMQLVPFPGWAPGYAGIVGGWQAAITEET